MTWAKYTCGRLESRYSYSNMIVYNNFPWPEAPSDKQKTAVEYAAEQVLEARKLFPKSCLADLYDPNSMPVELLKAHQALDKAVDLCYRPQPFATEAKRIEFLFELYEKYTASLFVEEKPKKSKIKDQKSKKIQPLPRRKVGEGNPFSTPEGTWIDGKADEFWEFEVAKNNEWLASLPEDEREKEIAAQKHLARKINS